MRVGCDRIAKLLTTHLAVSLTAKRRERCRPRPRRHAVIAETGAASVKDMGKVMAALKSGYAGQLDMSKASAMVKERLAGR